MPEPRRAPRRVTGRRTQSAGQDRAPQHRAVRSGEPAARSELLQSLEPCLAAWSTQGDAKRLTHWLDAALDRQGAPRDWPIADWPGVLRALAATIAASPRSLPAAWKTRINRLATTVLRFSRPDGTVVLSAPGEGEVLSALRSCAGVLENPALTRVVNEWSDVKLRDRPAPPLPAFSTEDRCLAILRADWSRQGDFVAIDHRDPGHDCKVELFGLGQRWLGPAWRSDTTTSPPRRLRWLTGPNADLAEWSFQTRHGSGTTRIALLLRGRQLALLAEEVTSATAEQAMQIDLAPGVRVEAVPQSRALKLSAGRGRSARVLPLALPALGYATERGRLEATDGRIIVRQKSSGGRTWMPLLFSWRPERNRQPVTWRQLTVSERSRVCPADEAVAVRVAWGNESLVIYRSLDKPDLRSFLGYQTEARFVVGLFSKKGELEPLLVVEDE